MYDCLHKLFIAVFWLLHKIQYNWHQLLKPNTAGRKENLSSWERKSEFPTSICFVFVPSFCIPWESFKDHDYKTQEGVFGKKKHQTVAPKKGLQMDLSKNLLPPELMKAFEHGGVMHRRWRICCSLRDAGRCATGPRNAGSDTLPSRCIHPVCSSRLQRTLTQPGQGKGTEIKRVDGNIKCFVISDPFSCHYWQYSFCKKLSQIGIHFSFSFSPKKCPKLGRETEREKVSTPYLLLLWESWSYFTVYHDNDEKKKRCQFGNILQVEL